MTNIPTHHVPVGPKFTPLGAPRSPSISKKYGHRWLQMYGATRSRLYFHIFNFQNISSKQSAIGLAICQFLFKMYQSKNSIFEEGGFFSFTRVLYGTVPGFLAGTGSTVQVFCKSEPWKWIRRFENWFVSDSVILFHSFFSD